MPHVVVKRWPGTSEQQKKRRDGAPRTSLCWLRMRQGAGMNPHATHRKYAASIDAGDDQGQLPESVG